MLELDDIQYILLTRVPALTGRYEFLSFQQPAQGRAWLEAIREKIPSAKAVTDTVNPEKRWVSVAFTWNGLRALGVDEASLATFPEELRQGMAARWQVLGDTGTNHPDNWVGGLGGPQLHAIAILFARDADERGRSVREHKALLARIPGVEVLSSLDLEAIPFRYVREHFGYRDRLTTPEIEGTGIEPTPGSGPPIKAGEFILGYPDEDGPAAKLRSRKFCLVTAATWHIGGYSSTWAPSATFCASKAGRPLRTILYGRQDQSRRRCRA
ncbi:MAG TPA: hypothetical protein VNY80_01930 [Steroidobacteraceae bacterium]|jgi:hypothetical protein|nr:hypothetical protein [Bradyrhizobium sp.]HWW28745.1 hypothetical protein [Steroidobacteraceae bacterium]